MPSPATRSKMKTAPLNNGESDSMFFDLSISPPAYIKPCYETIALISEQRHLDSLDAQSGKVLIVTDDWLLWRKYADRKWHVLYIETGLRNWYMEETPKTDLFCRVNKWVYNGSRDMTLFKGVSIGKQFSKEIARVYLTHLRLSNALQWFVETYRPDRILLFDFRVEQYRLPHLATLSLVKDVAHPNNIDVVVKDVPLSPGGSYERPPTMGRSTIEDQGLRRIARTLYACFIDFLFSLWCHRKKQAKKILMLTTGSMEKGLLASRPPKEILPLVPAERVPKTWSFVRQCLVKGIRLVRINGSGRLSESDRKAVDTIIRELEACWSENYTGYSLVERLYIQEEIIFSGQFHNIARQINEAEGFFHRHPKIERIFCAGSINPSSRIYLEAGNNRGIAIDEMLHGVRFSSFSYDSFSGDAFTKPFVSRLLAWGPSNIRWVEEMGTPMEVVCTGYPGITDFQDLKPLPKGADATVLFLPSVFNEEDYIVPTSSVHAFMVNGICTLQALGFRRIMVKLHPGTRDIDFFREIFRYFNLPGEIITGGNYMKYVEEADFVIGPLNSSSLVETLAHGTPYLTVLHEYSVASENLIGSLSLIRTAADIPEAIKNFNHDNRPELLDDFLNYPKIKDSVEETWKALTQPAHGS